MYYKLYVLLCYQNSYNLYKAISGLLTHFAKCDFEDFFLLLKFRKHFESHYLYAGVSDQAG